MKKLTKSVTYYNSLSRKEETTDLVFSIPDGFKTIDEAVDELKKIDIENKFFGFIKFLDMYYPVNIIGVSFTVIAKDIFYYRHDFFPINRFGSWEALKEGSIIHRKPASQTLWGTKLADRLGEFDPDFTCMYFEDKPNIENNSKVAFARCMFDTYLPLREMDVLNGCLDGVHISLKFCEINGIRELNPYTHNCTEVYWEDEDFY